MTATEEIDSPFLEICKECSHGKHVAPGVQFVVCQNPQSEHYMHALHEKHPMCSEGDP